MGASFFKTTSRGKSLNDAYDSAKQYAEDKYGYDPYNGTISTTSGVRDVTNEYRASIKDLSKYIEDAMDRMNKRDCWAICIQKPKVNTNKVKSQVEHIVTPGTKKWVLRYSVRHNNHLVGSWPTKGEALKDARRYTEMNNVPTIIEMEKLLEKGTATVAKVTYKKSSNEKDGEWVFFGWAAE